MSAHREETSSPAAHHRGVRLVGALLASAVLAVVAVVALAGSDHGASGLLGSHQASAATPVAPEAHTTLTALPDRIRLDGTTPLWVRLSGTPATSSARPQVSPTVAGAWRPNG